MLRFTFNQFSDKKFQIRLDDPSDLLLPIILYADNLDDLLSLDEIKKICSAEGFNQLLLQPTIFATMYQCMILLAQYEDKTVLKLGKVISESPYEELGIHSEEGMWWDGEGLSQRLGYKYEQSTNAPLPL